MFNQEAPTSTSGGMFTILEAGYDVDYGAIRQHGVLSAE